MTNSAAVEGAPVSRRDRYRQDTRQEIKGAARRQITDGGAGSLSLNALARSLGMAGPSLYRYFDSRDSLLTELLVDAYGELADAAEASVRPAGAPPSPDESFRRYAHAYRRWALDHPALYELLFGTPVPGYTAPATATGPPAARSMHTLLTVVAGVRGATPPPSSRVRPGPRWAGAHPGDEAVVVRSVRIWAGLHGIISLELRGHLASLVADPDAFYAAEVDHALVIART